MRPTRDAWIALARAAKAEVRELELALDRAALVAERDLGDDASHEFTAIGEKVLRAWRLIDAMRSLAPLPTMTPSPTPTVGN